MPSLPHTGRSAQGLPNRWVAFLARRATLVWSLVACGAGAWWFGRAQPELALSLFSVELSFTPPVFAHRLGAWLSRCGACLGSSPVDGGWLQFFRYGVVGIDFFVSAASVVFLSAVAVCIDRASRQQGGPERIWPSLPIVLSAILAAGLFDVAKNGALLVLLEGLAGGELVGPSDFDPGAVRMLAGASVLKWSAIALIAGSLLRSVLSGTWGEILRLSRYSLLSLMVGSVVLVATDQGRDLLAALGEHGSRRIAVFGVSLAVWGLSVWYWSRIVLDAAFSTSQAYPPVARHLPRVLGVLTLLAPVLPLLRLSDRGGWHNGLVGICVAQAVAFLIFVRVRRAWLDRRPGKPLRFTPAAAWDSRAGKVAVVSLAVSLTLFGLFVGCPLTAGDWFGTVAILFIAAANTVFFGSVVVFVSRTWQWRIEVLAFAGAATFSFWNDNHRVDHYPIRTHKPSLETVFDAWVAELDTWRTREGRTIGTNGARLNAYLVAAEGGGIRAAYWTATVLGGLNDSTDGEFAHHVFAVSGISGGSLGAAIVAGLARDRPGEPMRARATELMKSGYLAPVAAQAVTGDFLQWFLPFPIHAFDRSRGIETAFTRSYERVVPAPKGERGTFSRPFLDLRPSAIQGVPVLVLSSTAVESGGRVVAAPFSWGPEQLPDATDYHDLTGGDPTLASAVHNSARFPYVSPAGLLQPLSGEPPVHVIDGGYFDPSALDTMLDLYAALERRARDRHVHLIPLFVGNTPAGRCAAFGCGRAAPVSAASDDRDRRERSAYEGHAQPVEILGELFAPVRGVLRARNAHGRLAGARFDDLEDSRRFTICALPREESKDGGRAGATPQRDLDPPLGWELSDRIAEQLDTMWKQCVDIERGRAEILADFGKPIGVRR